MTTPASPLSDAQIEKLIADLDVGNGKLVFILTHAEADPLLRELLALRAENARLKALGQSVIVPEIFTCAACGKSFEWAPGSGTRHPRRDRGSYCSDACRLAARRASNLATWHRHKDEWRKQDERGPDAAVQP